MVNSHELYEHAKRGKKQFLPIPDRILDNFLKDQGNCPLCHSVEMLYVRNTTQAMTYVKYYLDMEDYNVAHALNKSGYNHNSTWIKHCRNCGSFMLATRWKHAEKGVRRRVMLDHWRAKAMLLEYGVKAH